MSDLGTRRSFIGGSDARVIMGDSESNLIQLWRQKRGEIEPEDLTHNLMVQLGTVNGSPILADVTVLGSDVAVRSTWGAPDGSGSRTTDVGSAGAPARNTTRSPLARTDPYSVYGRARAVSASSHVTT